MSKLKPCPFCGGPAAAGCAGVCCNDCHPDDGLGFVAATWERRPIEDALSAERDNFRAVLDGEGYQHLDKIAAETRDCTQIGAAAKARTLEIIAERDALRAEVAVLKAELDRKQERIEYYERTRFCHSRYAKRMILYTDTVNGEPCGMDNLWAVSTQELNEYEQQIAALKAELAKRDEPLTDEQAEQAFAIAKADGVGECDTLALGMQGIDAAIRRVRKGE